MPESPSWAVRLPEIENELEKFPLVFTRDLEDLLEIGRRRAQQIIAPCIIAHSRAARPKAVIERLRALVGKIDPEQEAGRRKQFASKVKAMTKERESALMVAAPTSIVNQQFEVSGVEVSAGEIRVSFSSHLEALEKLLALAMAIKNQPEEFEYLATGKTS